MWILSEHERIQLYTQCCHGLNIFINHQTLTIGSIGSIKRIKLGKLRLWVKKTLVLHGSLTWVALSSNVLTVHTTWIKVSGWISAGNAFKTTWFWALKNKSNYAYLRCTCGLDSQKNGRKLDQWFKYCMRPAIEGFHHIYFMWLFCSGSMFPSCDHRSSCSWRWQILGHRKIDSVLLNMAIWKTKGINGNTSLFWAVCKV